MKGKKSSLVLYSISPATIFFLFFFYDVCTFISPFHVVFFCRLQQRAALTGLSITKVTVIYKERILIGLTTSNGYVEEEFPREFIFLKEKTKQKSSCVSNKTENSVHVLSPRLKYFFKTGTFVFSSRQFFRSGT
jgi:hypothetical protein